MEKIVRGLNESQREAVLSSHPVILTLAGAGTGKTRTLTCRIAYLHQEKRIGTVNMLCLTFSRLAAKELKERIFTLIGENEGKKLTAGTFHAFCVMVLRQHGSLIGIERNFSIYDDDDRRSIVEEAIESFGGRTTYGKVLGVIGEPLDTIKTQAHEEYRVIKEYTYMLKRNNAVDLDKLIQLVNTLWKQHPDILLSYSREYSHVFVDEFQDTNDEQMEMIQLLNPKNLFVVGDDFQAIYGWRQAKVEYILTFQERYPACKVVKLQDNYRSNHGIVEVANRVIGYNENQSKKILLAHKDGITPSCHSFPDEFEEAKFVSSQIQDIVRDHGAALSDIAVLARNNAQIHRIKNVLVTNGVPAQVISNAGDVFKRHDIKLLFSWVEAIYNPRNDVNLKKTFSFPKNYFTKSDVSALELEALSEDAPLIAVIEKRETQFMSDYRAVQSKISETEAWTPSGCMRAVVEALQIGEFYGEQKLQNRIQDAEEAYAACLRWERSKEAVGEDKGITSFLRWLRYRDMQEKLIEEKDAVKLMTVHASKGLEFETVFVIGVSQGVFPSGRTSDLEEERRLFYVALTRAQERLVVTWPMETEPPWGGNPKPAEISQFILEAEFGV